MFAELPMQQRINKPTKITANNEPEHKHRFKAGSHLSQETEWLLLACVIERKISSLFTHRVMSSVYAMLTFFKRSF